jgi:hypothetical protein
MVRLMGRCVLCVGKYGTYCYVFILLGKCFFMYHLIRKLAKIFAPNVQRVIRSCVHTSYTARYTYDSFTVNIIQNLRYYLKRREI